MSSSATTLFSGSDPKSSSVSIGLRWYSKVLCLCTFYLLFAGALVTSHGAGLAVPDWPTTFGENMFLYPPSKWEGGIFFEHSHRLIASGVGFLTVVLVVWILRVETRRWVRNLSLAALVAVCLQGVLGGATVLLNLPDATSVAHGVLGQTFFVLTIILAYSQSKELSERTDLAREQRVAPYYKMALIGAGLVYMQLIVGAVMRHSDSGLAILDFPTMGGSYLPDFSDDFMANLNQMRVERGLAPDLSTTQVFLHLLHRIFAFLVLGHFIGMLIKALKRYGTDKLLIRSFTYLTPIVMLQIALGIMAVLSIKDPYITSYHVIGGAALLGMMVMLVMRVYPTRS